MITYPLNNIDYTAEDAELFHCTRTSGIWATNDFPISVTGRDNNISIGTGIAWIRNEGFSGKVVALKETVIRNLDVADGVYPRIDVVAIQFNANNNATDIVVKKGVPASDPVRPAISRTGAVYELYLCSIYRRVGVTSIAWEDVTDLRLDSTVCGLMADSVTKVDTNAINNQVKNLIMRLDNEINAVKNNSNLMFTTDWTQNGVIPIAKGGLGASNPAEARNNLGVASKEDLTLYLPRSGGSLTGDITVPRGTAYQSLDNAGVAKPLVWMSSEDTVNLGAVASNGAHSGNTQVNAPNGSVYFKCKNDKILQWYYDTDSNTGTKTVFAPNKTAESKLGSSNYRWYKLYASTACSTSSDEREKSDIMSIDDYPVTYSRDGSGNVFEKLFDKLSPKTYTLNVENSGRLHVGFVAQDIVNAFEELGLSENDLALLDHDYWIDEETNEEKDRYGLVYEEFIALNTYMIKKQQEKIAMLEKRIAQLETEEQ